MLSVLNIIPPKKRLEKMPISHSERPCRVSPKEEAVLLRARASRQLKRAKALQVFEKELGRSNREFEQAMSKLFTRAQRRRYEELRAGQRKAMDRIRQRLVDTRDIRELAARAEAAQELAAFLKSERIDAEAPRGAYRKRARAVASALTRLVQMSTV